MKLNIVELDGYAANPGDLSWAPLKQLGNFTVYPRTSPEQVVERAKDADIVLINKVNITDEVMAQLPRLKYIGVLATGYNVVDVEAAHRRNITVTNIPAYSTASVVQHTFALLLNITNQVDHYATANRSGRWASNPDFCYWDKPLHELAGKTMGIVGLGHIGMSVAKIARDFGMDIFAVTSKHSTDLPQGIQKTTLQGLLGVADVVSLHCPLTKDTFHLINEENIGSMKPDAILLNTGRGPLVDEVAVAQALHEGKLGAYGADVLSEEPPHADNPLFKEEHAFVTPHIAWATVEARQRLMDICVENVKAFIAGQPINKV
ncbi:MAG: D-2-hydroxyacid dehydrogenase [Prevotella sp.]|jgi:glycerate dehydrogenase